MILNTSEEWANKDLNNWLINRLANQLLADLRAAICSDDRAQDTFGLHFVPLRLEPSTDRSLSLST
jgi:hypothetical protein